MPWARSVIGAPAWERVIASLMAAVPNVRVNVTCHSRSTDPGGERETGPTPVSRPYCSTRMGRSVGLHPSHHLALRGVQLPLAPLARFLEVLVTTQIGENSSLLALLLEPAKGTLEGLAFFDPDAGH